MDVVVDDDEVNDDSAPEPDVEILIEVVDDDAECECR